MVDTCTLLLFLKMSTVEYNRASTFCYGKNSMNEDYLTVGEVAQDKGISTSAVYKAIDQGRIGSQRILGRLALKRSEVAAWQPKERTGRRVGSAMSEEGKARISAGQKSDGPLCALQAENGEI